MRFTLHHMSRYDMVGFLNSLPSTSRLIAVFPDPDSPHVNVAIIVEHAR